MSKTEKPKAEKKVKLRKGQDLLRQKRLARLLIADGGKTTISKIMLQAGYSKAYSRNPQKVKKTLSWVELMDKYIPENKVAQKHKELLYSERLDHAVMSPTLSDEEIVGTVAKIQGSKFIRLQRGKTAVHVYYTVADTRSRKDGIDMAYKLRGTYHIDKATDKANENLEKALDRLSALLP